MLTIEKLALGLMRTNCYILISGDGDALVIDPGAHASRLLERLASLNVTVKHILLTHAHFDHIGAVDALYEKYGCDVMLAEEDMPLLYDPELNCSKRFGREITVRNVPVTALEEGRITLLGEEFEIIKTPGHTPGSLCILNGGNLFTGDTLFLLSIGHGFPPLGSVETEIRSIKEKLMTLSGDYICYPGHDKETSLDFERRNNPYLNR